MNEWINAEYVLPIIPDKYLVCLSNGEICIGLWSANDFWSIGYYSNKLEVSHWMYLPAAPKRII